METGISLGWRCEAASLGVNLNLRQTMENGYLTCPFDLCVTNYIGICKCIEDDFKYFCDPKYIILKKAPKMEQHIKGSNDNEYFIFNTYYNFAFNHESPGHGNLYINEKWTGGINHYVSNNYEKFIERYQRRIDNFRNYLKSGNKINFLILYYNGVPNKLDEVISKKYPELNFTIYCWTKFTPFIISQMINSSIEGVCNFEIEYLRYMNIDRDTFPDEYDRFYTTNIPLINNNNKIVIIS